jgi:DNA-binding NarL/FixJ family response regulator
MSHVRVFLADHHLMVREGFRVMLLAAGLDVVGEASDGHSTVNMCARLKPQVALLELALPLLNGVDATRELGRICPPTRVLLLTTSTEPLHVLAGLRAGAAGYVLKTDAASILKDAIGAVARNETYLSTAVSRTVVQGYLSSAGIPADPLSIREREIVQLIAEGKNAKEIAGILRISARTAETRRARIMAKLGIQDIAGLVRYAVAQGLIAVERVEGAGGWHVPSAAQAQETADPRPVIEGAFPRTAS